MTHAPLLFVILVALSTVLAIVGLLAIIVIFRRGERISRLANRTQELVKNAAEHLPQPTERHT